MSLKFNRCLLFISIYTEFFYEKLDGLNDFNIEKSLLKKTNISNNQICWIFTKLLPPRVHMIVTVKQIFNKTKLGSFNSINSLSSANSTTDENVISLFLSYLNNNSQNFTESNLFELPLSTKSLQPNISEFIKKELAKKNLKLSYNQIDHIIQNAVNACRVLNITKKEPNNSDQFFLYIDLVLYEIMNKSISFVKTEGHLDEKNLPIDCESMVKAKIRKFKKRLY